MPVEALASSLAAMARAQAMQPRPPKPKPEPVVFTPTDPATVAMRIGAALEALDGLELEPPFGMACHQRRYANQLHHAVAAVQRELLKALAVAQAAEETVLEPSDS
jgi:hypothetical protein